VSKASDIPKIPKFLWDKARVKVLSMIKKDASEGIFQNGKRNFKYSTKGSGVGWRTIKVKGNSKRVFIDSYGNMKRRGMEIPGYGRIKKYEGVRINRSKSGWVDMSLTGETLNRITTKSIKDGFKLVFARGDIVEGNAKRGYVLADLRDENYKVIEKMIGTQLDRNIRKYTTKSETFKIGG